MTELELYRNFVAIVRAGSVSGAARSRHLTQPAISQQLAALEEVAGVQLFRRTRKGMISTERGKALYAQLMEPIDSLERVTRSLRGQRIVSGSTPLRLGTSPDYLQSVALPKLQSAHLRFTVAFGDPKDLLLQLETGAFDAVISTQPPTARTLQHWVVSEHHFVLAASVKVKKPKRVKTLPALGAWLASLSWLSYSLDLPITRRFWQQALGRRFDAKLALVIPDLRAVLHAVELGYGVSILPDFIFQDGYDAGKVHELWPIRSLIPSERWFLSIREVDGDRPDLKQFIDLLSV